MQMQNPQQNNNKLNLTMYKNNYTSRSGGIYPRYTKPIQKSINVICHINRLKNKTHLNIPIEHNTMPIEINNILKGQLYLVFLKVAPKCNQSF